MMRLPYREGNAEGLGACFVGIPMDIGCSNRSGTRYGPQALRQESRLLKTVNITGKMIERVVPDIVSLAFCLDPRAVIFRIP